MAESHKFRKSFRGFNREDVVRYIEFLNKKNTGIVNQLKSENQGLKDELEILRAAGADTEKDALIAELQAQVAELTAAQEQAAATTPSEEELEAYRRAERAEREAKERAQQLYQQATATLADATTLVDQAAQQFGAVAESVNEQIAQLQAAVDSSKAALQDAAATMYAIRPQSDEE